MYKKFYLISFIIIISGCASSQNLHVKELEENLEQTRLQLEDYVVQLLDLKSDVIVLQSELIQAKQEVINLHSQSAVWEETLKQKETEIIRIKEALYQKDEKIKQLEKGINKEKPVSPAAARTDSSAYLPGFTETIPAQSKRPVSSSSSDVITGERFSRLYKQALKYYFEKKYQKAIEEFTDLILYGRDDELLDNCQYWIGECFYSIDDYPEAIEAFQQLLQKYPESNKRDHSQLKLGMCYMRLGNRREAKSAFQKLIQLYPDSEHIQLAREYLKQL